MKIKKNWLIFILILFCFWIYNMYYFVSEIKYDNLDWIFILGNLFTNLYILGSIIYIIYLKFFKNNP